MNFRSEILYEKSVNGTLIGYSICTVLFHPEHWQSNVNSSATEILK